MSMQSKQIKNRAPEANSLGTRLRIEMKNRGMSSAELAKTAEVKTSFLYDVISGKSANPSPMKLARVADALGISLSYLVGITDRMTPDIFSGRSHNEYVTIPRISLDISTGAGTIKSEEIEGERYCFRQDWIKNHLNANPADMRMLYIRGDSMEPTLCHNDLVLLDVSKKQPSPPGIFIVFDGFGLAAKRLEYTGSDQPRSIRIISDNAQYSTYERSVDATFIIGRIVWFAREI